jgi:hypothetical protein
MTGNVSMSQSSGHDVTTFLDRLDQAHAAATKPPWHQDHGWGENVLSSDGETVAGCNWPTDAAAIVAEHNAIGDLLRATRGVLWWADQLATEADLIDRIGHQADVAAAKRDAAAGIRTAVDAALGVETTEAGQ